VCHFTHGHANFTDVRFDLGGAIKVSVSHTRKKRGLRETIFSSRVEWMMCSILVKISQTDIQILKTGVQLAFICPDVQLLDQLWDD
jgi:hypothetical protein